MAENTVAIQGKNKMVEWKQRAENDILGKVMRIV